MDSEIHYEGWLIKSPPTKRIWRARWRRRYFALKQGELPGQYLLEYYTDQTCRKLKGVIDLDQCEQVDAGLFMERKFPHVFNVKTPRRTYYLAADTDDTMRYWVNCICNVCGLQDFSKVPPECEQAVCEAPTPTYFNLTPTGVADRRPSLTASVVEEEERTYQNNDFAQKVLNVSNTQQPDTTMPARQVHSPPSSQISAPSPAVSRKEPAEEQGKLEQDKFHASVSETAPDHDYYNDVSMSSTTSTMSSMAFVQKRPENLQLSDLTNNHTEPGEPSPALSTSSGPYIPICECFSGSPVLANNSAPPMPTGAAFASYVNNFAPLNSLSRRTRIDIAKSPLNIGHLNLTDIMPPPPSPRQPVSSQECGRSSDESESVFTDDDDGSSHSGSHTGAGQGTSSYTEAQLRRLRPSDSSIENENIGWTAMQRYSKLPTEEKKCLNSSDPPPRPPKPVVYGTIGPLDSSSCVVEERYEIPRSHRNPEGSPPVGESTAISAEGDQESQPRRRSHFYTNAAPSNLEGQVFRYDFSDSSDSAAPPPAINRNLKPKITAAHVPTRSCDQIGSPRTSLFLGRQSLQMTPSRSDDKLQYLDLDHTNGPLPSARPEPIRNTSSTSAQNIHAAVVGLPAMHHTTQTMIKHSISEHNTAASSGGGSGSGTAEGSGRGIVYKTVDFVKTEAFNRTRQDAEMNRASNKDK